VDNTEEAAVVEGVDVYGARSLSEVGGDATLVLVLAEPNGSPRRTVCRETTVNTIVCAGTGDDEIAPL